RMHEPTGIVVLQCAIERIALAGVFIERVRWSIDQVTLKMKAPRSPPHVFGIGIIALRVFVDHRAPTAEPRAGLDMKDHAPKRRLRHQHGAPGIWEVLDCGHGSRSIEVGGPGFGALTTTAPAPLGTVVMPLPPLTP